MEYLSLPQNVPHLGMEVPLLEVEDYDGDEFASYPDRQGWQARTSTEWLVLFDKPPRAFGAFMERWLLLGPLSVACKNLTWDTSDFLIISRDDPARASFTTANLAGFLSDAMEQGGPDDEKKLVNIDVAPLLSCLMMALGMCKRLSRVIGPGDDCNDWARELPTRLPLFQFLRMVYVPDPRSQEVSIATNVIIEVLFLLGRTVPDEAGNLVDGTIIPSSSVPVHSAFWVKFREMGWCPSDMLRLFQRFNTFGLHFIYHLPRPRNTQMHHMIRVRKQGSSGKTPNENTKLREKPPALCTTDGCAARKFQDTTYSTKHADGCDGCHDVVADPQQLAVILESGQIPLILSIDDEDESETITLVEAEADMAYVAISHVWSDGLGNVQRNSIPWCQLRRLSRLTRSLIDDNSNLILFWLDTICVPPDSAKMDRAQAAALGKMRAVYENATVVLVLDSWLFNTPIQNKPHLEVLVMIFVCPWNTRLWTYQEGALPRSLYFQFSDKAYDLDQGIRQLTTNIDLVSRITMVPSLSAIYFDLRGFKNRSSTEDKLGAIASAFKSRVTSVAEDEPICIATLLGLDAEVIALTEPSRRMEVLWKMIPIVPWWVAFSGLPTHDVQGLHWAPLSFLQRPLVIMPSSHVVEENEEHRSIFNDRETAKQSHGRLILKSSGLRAMVGPASTPVGRNFYARDEHGRWILIKRLPEMDELRPEDLLHGCIEIAIIDYEDWRFWGAATPEANQPCRGILVRIDREPMPNAPIYCTRLYRVLSVPVHVPEVIASCESNLGPRLPGGPWSTASFHPENRTLFCVNSTTCIINQIWAMS
ncbi:hypothetical protein F4782DRAFT_509859 [Xylaria castorea]|nr:hypothetical protein F4782DRAFT_509859 [Xylaria castorea]